jgi:long-subunit acyl-CoA synthetase (AMP-forming)
MPWGFPLANRLVLSKVRVALGLDRCQMCFTGAAPISAETLNFFGALYICRSTSSTACPSAAAR